MDTGTEGFANEVVHANLMAGLARRTPESIIVRFNPSANGCLHVGHLLAALVNEGDGQVLHVRVTDHNEQGATPRDRIARRIAGMQEDLDWIGLRYDSFRTDSSMLEEIEDRYRDFCAKVQVPMTHGVVPDQLMSANLSAPSYGYTPRYTFQKVVLDYMQGVNLLIRGEELVTELSLYCYYCDVLGFPIPRQVFIPRLNCPTGEISKTAGNYKVSALRQAGYSAEDVKYALSLAALRVLPNGFHYWNLKEKPVLSGL